MTDSLYSCISSFIVGVVGFYAKYFYYGNDFRCEDKMSHIVIKGK